LCEELDVVRETRTMAGDVVRETRTMAGVRETRTMAGVFYNDIAYALITWTLIEIIKAAFGWLFLW
jgi:hypothetical protein